MGNSVNHLFKGKEVPSREVATSYGKVRGRRLIFEGDRQVDAFQGIPFAKAPLGELRFKKPQPPEPWDGVRPAVKFARRGIQRDFVFVERFVRGPCSEDCLYLNVFTPVWSKGAPFPVMVFVHGGAFVADSAIKYGDIGICTHLVAAHGVIVVTVQYRLGYLGFFSTADDACDDNVGLWDMTMALQWVKDEIPQFGGDPSNITVFGQSAGGASVDLLAQSPQSRELFQKVNPIAGNASCEWAISDDAVETCRLKAADLAVCTHDSHEGFQMIEGLRKVPAVKFGAAMRLQSEGHAKLQTEIGPRIGGSFLPRPVKQLRSEAPRKSFMTGVCEYEGLLFQIFAKDNSYSKIERIIAERIPEVTYSNFTQLRKEALALYIDPKDRYDKPVVNKALAELYSDLFLGIGTQACVLDELEAGTPEVYLYSFDYCNPKSFGFLSFRMPFKAATHCTELAYIFGVGIINDFTYNEDDNKMIQITTKLWTNFAKYGNPNGSPEEPESQLPFQWLPATKEHPTRYLSINLQSEMKEKFHGERLQFWLNLKPT